MEYRSSPHLGVKREPSGHPRLRLLTLFHIIRETMIEERKQMKSLLIAPQIDTSILIVSQGMDMHKFLQDSAIEISCLCPKTDR